MTLNLTTNFSARRPEAQANKKLDKLAFIKIKDFSASKDTNQRNDKTTYRTVGKILASHVSGKGLVSRT